MDPLDYAKTPTGRKFGATGSLVGQPSLLERRQAITDMAAVNNREASLARRLFRQYSRASRKGDTDAGEKAMDLFDRANEKGIELGGIQSYDQRMNAAGQDLFQRIQTNQALLDAESGREFPTEDSLARGGAMTLTAQGWTPNETLAPAASGAMTLTAQGWTPNETLTTDPVQAQEGIVGGPSGIDATPIRSGPSPAEGGIMAARRKASTPIYSSRGIEQQTPPQSLDPNYGPPVGFASTDFDKKFPAISGFMKRLAFMERAGGVKDYKMFSTPSESATGVNEWIASESDNWSDAEEAEWDIADYRSDERYPAEEMKRRREKRAKIRAVDFAIDERSRRIENGTSTIRRLPTPGATF